MKGKKELDHPFNLEPLCRECHASGEVNGYEHRRRFFHEQVALFGEDFLDWWNGLPLKVKPNYE